MKSLRRSAFWMLLLVAVWTGAQEPEWYHSNRDFMVLEPLPREGSEPPSAGWFLMRIRTDGTEERILYRDGIERGRETAILDAAGREIGRRRENDQGLLVFEERYRFRPDGSLRGVLRCDDTGECIEIRYEGIAAGEELLGPDFELRYSYDDSGRASEEYRREGDDAELRRSYTYRGDRLAETRTVQGDLETVERFEGGLTVAVVTRDQGRLVSEVRFEYDTQDRVILREEWRRRSVARDLFEYPEVGGSIRERTENGVLVEREIETPEGARTVERYVEGELVVRSVFEGDRVIRRETWIDGALVSVEREPAPVEDAASMEKPASVEDAP